MSYEITEAMRDHEDMPDYIEAMAACWDTAAAALEARALATLWRVELASEPGGKEDAVLIQRHCPFSAEKKVLRWDAHEAHQVTIKAHEDAIDKWGTVVGDDDANWEDWPGGARHEPAYTGKFRTPWGEVCNNAWRRAQTTFGEQMEVMAAFCEGCKAASEGGVVIQQVEIVGGIEVNYIGEV